MRLSGDYVSCRSIRRLFGTIAAVPLLCAGLGAQGTVAASNAAEPDDAGWALGVRVDADRVVRAAEVRLNGARYRLELHPYSLRAPDFRVLVQTEDGLVDYQAPESRTYSGSLEDEQGQLFPITGGLNDDGSLTAAVSVGGESFSIEPAGDVWGLHRIRRASPDLMSETTCGALPTGFEPSTSRTHQPGAFSGEKTCKIAFDADFEFYQLHGSSVDATVQDIESVLLSVGGIYAFDVGIGYVLTTIVVRTTSSDPYTQDDSSLLLSQFKSVWQSTMSTVDRNVAHLMTGRNLLGTDIGRAYFAGICNSNGYGLSESLHFGLDYAERVCVTAHELGHNWNADHCSGHPCYIMCATLNGCSHVVDEFEAGSQAVIESYRDSVASCLYDYVGGSPILNDGAFLTDRFVGPSLDPQRWIYVKGATINQDAVDEPDLRSSLNLSAFGSGTYQDHEVRTRGVAFQQIPANFTISFATQHRGVEVGESLVVEYYADPTHWKELVRITSDGVNQDAFEWHTFSIPADIYDGGIFSILWIRFRTEVNESNDDWYVDSYRYGPAVTSTLLTTPRLTLSDPFPPDEAARLSVCSTGDRNADNKDDLMVGYPADNRVLVFSGLNGTYISEIVGTPPTFQQFGAAIANPWNLGNGCLDLLWGAPGSATTPGSMTRLCGGAPVFGSFNGDQFGASVASLGADVDSDGVDDLVVGAPALGSASPGYVRIVSGANGSTIRQFNGSQVGSGFGFSVDGAGDADGDGFPDVVIGSPFSSSFLNGPEVGLVQVFSGATGAFIFSRGGEAAGDHVGFSVSGVGDLNQDGLADIIVGIPGRDDTYRGVDAGRVLVLDTTISSNAGIIYDLVGEFEQDHFGWSVDGIRDINRDGKPDILVGAPGGDFAADAGASQGESHIFSGANGSELYVMRGSTAGEFFGDAVAYGGKVQNKGNLQVIVSAPARGTPPVKKALVFTIPNSGGNIQQGGL